MPRATTWDDYRSRIERVATHIEQHLDEPCPLNELAGLAAFSPCHFHRVFRAVTGEGVAEHLRRLRLERAAKSLRMTDRQVVDIALEAGYEAHESFTRAFESAFGEAPSRYRAERGLSTRCDGPELAQVEYGVATIGPLRLVRMRNVGSYDKVGETFGRLAEWVGVHGLFGPWTCAVGQCHDDPEITESEKLRYHAAFTVPREVEGSGEVEYAELPRAEYVKALHRGPYSRLSLTYAALIRSWLVKGGRALAPDGSLEFYLNTPADTAPENLLTEICLRLG